MSETDNKNITKDIVKYVADLSRLSMDDVQVDKFQSQLSGILDYIGQLDEVDTDNVDPTSHVLSSMKNVFREDVPGKSLSNEEALSNAPQKKDGFFKVPRVI